MCIRDRFTVLYFVIGCCVAIPIGFVPIFLPVLGSLWSLITGIPSVSYTHLATLLLAGLRNCFVRVRDSCPLSIEKCLIDNSTDTISFPSHNHCIISVVMLSLIHIRQESKSSSQNRSASATRQNSLQCPQSYASEFFHNYLHHW